MKHYFFCAMNHYLGSTSPTYLHGVIETALDPTTTEGLIEITKDIAKEFDPPAEVVTLLAFNRL
jgi:hypothetical protein